MKKQRITLTESQLYRVINNTVNKFLNESFNDKNISQAIEEHGGVNKRFQHYTAKMNADYNLQNARYRGYLSPDTIDELESSGLMYDIQKRIIYTNDGGAVVVEENYNEPRKNYSTEWEDKVRERNNNFLQDTLSPEEYKEKKNRYIAPNRFDTMNRRKEHMKESVNFVLNERKDINHDETKQQKRRAWADYDISNSICAANRDDISSDFDWDEYALYGDDGNYVTYNRMRPEDASYEANNDEEYSEMTTPKFGEYRVGLHGRDDVKRKHINTHDLEKFSKDLKDSLKKQQIDKMYKLYGNPSQKKFRIGKAAMDTFNNPARGNNGVDQKNKRGGYANRTGDWTKKN